MRCCCECGGCLRHSLSTLLAGFGLLVDLYDFSIINLAKPLLEDGYGEMNKYEKGALTSAALLGAVLGQLVFGALADILGRRTIFIATALIVTIASIGSATVVNTASVSIYTQLTIWRFVLGFGVGGEYPLAAAHTAENRPAPVLDTVATERASGIDEGAALVDGAAVRPEEDTVAATGNGGRCTRISSGQSLAAVYSMMGIGKLLAPLTVLTIQSGGASPELTWRLAFGFGGFLSFLSFVMRLGLLKESTKYAELQDVTTEGESETDEGDEGPQKSRFARCAAWCSAGWITFVEIMQSLVVLWKPLLGTAGCWFLFDIVDYGVGLYSAEIFTASTPMETTLNVLYLALMNEPGFLLAIVMVTVLGRKGNFNTGRAHSFFRVQYD